MESRKEKKNKITEHVFYFFLVHTYYISMNLHYTYMKCHHKTHKSHNSKEIQFMKEIKENKSMEHAFNFYRT